MRHMHQHEHHMPGPGDEIPAPAGVPEDTFAVFVGFKNVMFLHRRLMMKLLAEEETHPAQAGCLHILSHRDGLSQSELADKLHVSRPTVTTMLQKMEASGVIERRPDDRDQRLNRIFMTPSGRQLVARLDAVFAQVMRAGVDPMAEKDRAELARLLGQLSDNLSCAIEDA